MPYLLKRTEKFVPIPSKEEKEEIKRLDDRFFENDHKLLRGGRMKAKDMKSIDSLYYKFFKNVDNYDWSKSLVEMELDNLKSDQFCRKNTNKSYWSKAIILNWLANLPNKASAEYLYRQLDSRLASQRLVKFAYWQ